MTYLEEFRTRLVKLAVISITVGLYLSSGTNNMLILFINKILIGPLQDLVK